MKRFLAHVIVALGAALSTASLVHAEILIGVPMPLTGGMAWKRGAALAIANLNAAGGVLGEPVRAVVVDDLCEGEQAVAAIQIIDPTKRLCVQ